MPSTGPPRPADGTRSRNDRHRPLTGDNGGVSLYRDEGVVLRTQKLGEADRIVTFLTRRHGRVRAVGKGVRRTKSEFGSRLEPFMQVDVQFARGRTLDIVTQAETIAPHGDAIAATQLPREDTAREVSWVQAIAARGRRDNADRFSSIARNSPQVSP